MSDKTTLPQLVNLLALETGDSKKQAEEFIKEFINAVSIALVNGDMVRIKGFGIFKTVAVEGRKSVDVTTGEDNHIPPHRKIVFVPSREVAVIINSPFEMFDTMPLQSDADLADELANTDSNLNPVQNQNASLQTSFEDTEDQIPSDDTAEVVSASGDIQSEEEYSSVSSDLSDSYDQSDMSDSSDQSDQSDQSDLSDSTHPVIVSEAPAVRRQKWPKFMLGFLSGIVACVAVGVIAIGCAIYFEWDSRLSQSFSGLPGFELILASKHKVNNTTAEELSLNRENPVRNGQPGDSTDQELEEAQKRKELKEKFIAAEQKKQSTLGEGQEMNGEKEVPTQPSDKKVYDTISKTRYLTTMARDHYGNYHLWPYIYMENATFLGHPDRIKPGTRVVIPPLSKYGVNPSNPSDISKAKREGVKIYSRYK